MKTSECRGNKSIQIEEISELNKSIEFTSDDYYQVELLKIEELPGSVRRIYREWDDLSQESKKILFNDIFEKENYWGYFFSTWAKYSFYTENPKILRIFQEALRFVKNEYSVDGVIMTEREVLEGHWYRETFARNMRLLLDAYSYTNDLAVLGIIEEQTNLWIGTNEKSNVKGFKIYPYSSKLKNARSSEINPNQNLQMGLVFSKLYFNEKSKFYMNDFIKESALNEIKAGLSLVRENGFFPLNQHAINVGDSNYAGLSTIVLYELAQIWADPDFIDILKRVGIWLEKSFNESRPWNTKDDLPDYHFDQFTAFNLFSRIPAFYAAGLPSQRAKQWMEFVKTKFTDFQILDLTPRWDNLQSLPENYYSNHKRNKDLKHLPPKLYVRKEDNVVFINVVGSEIKDFKICQLDQNSIKDGVFEDLEIKEGDQLKVYDVHNNMTTLVFGPLMAGSHLKVFVNFFDYNNPIKNK
ncbi:hypothetical protein BC751_2279 [Cecembia calidifontis]|uniref:Uncharacterized protein n=1 Tax=Cecembia calidifontis TaxID=1187080 RepID=A0A4Q7P9U6_9BACT|nr:hypothetical protein BC751_2279 [Cecembia calidifontis]